MFLQEMSTIGVYDNHKITVYEEPFANPSFHVRYKDEWEVILQIKDFEILEKKFGKYEKGTHLPKKEIKELVNYLQQNNKFLKNNTNWEYLITTWNTNNPRYEVSIDFKIPIQ
jgi:hypothetical protein